MEANKFWLFDVFTRKRYFGNQLAIVDSQAKLSTETMLRIAAEFGYSETVFMECSGTGETDFDMRIFTPTTELDFAGHPTLGAIAKWLMVDLKPSPGEEKTVRIGQNIGGVEVSGSLVSETEARCEFVLPLKPECREAPVAVGDIARMLGIKAGDIGFAGCQAMQVTAGPSFLFVPVASEKILYQAVLDTTVWEDCLASTDCPNLYVFTQTDCEHYHARMFAPAMGQAEDAATGAAAGGLAAYLNAGLHSQNSYNAGTIHQGVFLGRDSELKFQYEETLNEVRRIMVSGYAVIVAEGVLYV